MSCPDVASVGVLELALEDLVEVAGLGQLGEGIVEGQVNDLKRKIVSTKNPFSQTNKWPIL